MFAYCGWSTPLLLVDTHRTRYLGLIEESRVPAMNTSFADMLTVFADEVYSLAGSQQ
jgi:hypothetical protein